VPREAIYDKFQSGQLHSGSKTGPVVKSRAQANAIAMKYKTRAEGGGEQQQPRKKKSAFEGM
jgi:hypothetical protein